MHTALVVFFGERESGGCEGRRDASERRRAQSSEPTTQSFSFNTVNNTLE